VKIKAIHQEALSGKALIMKEQKKVHNVVCLCLQKDLNLI